jgi:DNA-binding response OmpR family regulator
MRQILLAGLPPKTGEWLAYRLRGETVEVLFSADDLIGRVQGDCGPSLVVLSACGAVHGVERQVARVRAACGPAVPLVVEVDSAEAGLAPGLLGALVHEHGVRRVVPSSASRGDLLAAVLAYLPEAAQPAPAGPRFHQPAAAPPLHRFPAQLEPAAPAVDTSYRVPAPPPRIELGIGGIYGFSAPPAPRAASGEYEPLVLMDTSLQPEVRAAATPEPAAALEMEVDPQPSEPRPVVLVVSADGALYDAFARAAGTDYEVRVGRFAELLRMERDDRDAPAAVLVDVPAGEAERMWRLLDRICRRLPRLPVLVTTSSDALDDRVNAVRVGAHACIQKPVAPDTAREVLVRAVPPRRPAAPRVLVLDDDAAVLRAADELFSRLGWQVQTVAEPRTLWEALASGRPDLLILDADLPGVDGLDLCRAVRSDPRWRKLPVLFLTATTDTPWLYRAYAAGADDHVAKPFWGPDLVSRARNRLRRADVACV